MSEQVATKFISVIPPLMNIMRTEVRLCASPCLSIPQFRVLANINRGLNHVSEIANLHGVSQPSMTKLVNNLVDKKLVSRELDQLDKRVVNLYLTDTGRELFKSIRKKASKKLAKKLNVLSDLEKEKLNDFFDIADVLIEKISDL